MTRFERYASKASRLLSTNPREEKDDLLALNFSFGGKGRCPTWILACEGGGVVVGREQTEIQLEIRFSSNGFLSNPYSQVQRLEFTVSPVNEPGSNIGSHIDLVNLLK